MNHCCCGTHDCPTLRLLHDSQHKINKLEQQNSLAGEFGQSYVMSLAAQRRISWAPRSEQMYGEKSIASDHDSTNTAESTTLTFMLQALLARHENYVAEAERDRRRMMEKISSLEQHTVELEGVNKRTIQENRDLLDQLEALNGAVKDSESKVQSLSEVLSSTEYELERMTGLAARTEELHQQMTQLEEDLAAANSMVTITTEESRAAVLRWQDAKKTITSLQSEIERIEGDAKVERERHVDVVERMEKRKAVESKLRKSRPWKLANDVTSDGSGVVSHFVKDILQDNANLQLGIVELREMLQRSNNEIERLRDDVLQSSPRIESANREGAQTPALSSELDSTREVHVHHHYHAPNRASDARKPRSHVVRRKSKQRTSGHSTPRSSISLGPPSSSSAILQNAGVSVPQRNFNRWSMQSGVTASSSSLPGSPYSESIFDHAFQDNATDISCPSTPDSMLLSPRVDQSASKFETNNSDALQNPDTEPAAAITSTDLSNHAQERVVHASTALVPFLPDHPVIIEENEDAESSQILPSSPPKPFASDFHPISPIRPMRRRANSHESLISIHGMDIHTLKIRPSQLLLGQYVSTVPTASSEATVTDTSAFAIRASAHTRQEQRRTTSQTYLSGIAASQKDRDLPSKDIRPSLKGKVGGWVWGRWGAKPVAPVTSSSNTSGKPLTQRSVSSAASLSSKSTADTCAATTPKAVPAASTSSLAVPSIAEPVLTSPSAAESHLSSATLPPRKMFMRPPGVNQSGPIFGFPPEKKLDPTPVMKRFDPKALQDVLEH